MISPGSNPEELIAQCRNGDTQALGRLLEPYRNYLSLLARTQIGRRLQSKLDASDLVQDTFVAAQRDFPRFGGTTEAELLGWLQAILAHKLTDQVRRFGRGKRDAALEQQLAEEMDHSSQALQRGLVAEQSSPSQQAARRELAVHLADALEQLRADKPEYADVIELHDLEQLNWEDVARRMGRTVDSVKKLWPRAVARLRCSPGVHR